MHFNKATTIEAVKRGLSTSQKKDTNGISLSLGLAIDDLARKIRSSRFLRSYDLSVDNAKREVEVRGENNDLAHIFALKLGTGVTQRVLEWVDPQSFLRDHDDPSAVAGEPNKYTVLTYSGEGYPMVRFEKPLSGSDTIKVLYYLEVTGDAPVSLPATVLVQGTLAYFHGTSTPEGSAAYERFKEGAIVELSSAGMNPEVNKRFRLNREDRTVIAIQRSITASRR